MIRSNLHNPQNILYIFHLFSSHKNIQRDLPLNYVFISEYQRVHIPCWLAQLYLEKLIVLVVFILRGKKPFRENRAKDHNLIRRIHTLLLSQL